MEWLEGLIMKSLNLILIVCSAVLLGCSGSSKVGSISDNSEKLSEAEPIDERDLKAYQSAVQHGDERTFRYEYGSQVTFFEASRYCYSYGEDALKFVTNDSKSVISIPVEKIQICEGGTEIWTPKSNGKVFLDHLSGGAQKGFYFGGEFFFEAAKATMGSNPVIGSLMLVMTPVGFAVGASVGTVVGGTAGLVGMGINYADGIRVCRGDLTEKEKTEFLESHLCFKH
ncbi:hypothetical protein [Fibrobacter sp. HC4]|uniref:hypothetical protein n=1 Tax=Fibrobacter sp. HC4 TaxID=3239812 RepID=UPI00201A125A|nr:hypothetical protein [Fibrobacter succinogenes]